MKRKTPWALLIFSIFWSVAALRKITVAADDRLPVRIADHDLATQLSLQAICPGKRCPLCDVIAGGKWWILVPGSCDARRDAVAKLTKSQHRHDRSR